MQMILGHLNFKDKRVVIMGLGVYPRGTGIAAVKFFLSRGARVLITDLKTKKMLAPRVREVVRIWSTYTGKAHRPVFVLGRHRLRDFLTAEYIFQNPSVPAESPFLSRARHNGVPILNDWSIFLNAHRPGLFIGVTGTRGKSTTTTLIYRMLKKKYQQVRLCGNIGVSPLTFIDTYRGEPVVAELSSWLLHHFASVKKSPHVAVVTNIMRDHLDKYKSAREYIADKENIFRFQRPPALNGGNERAGRRTPSVVVLNYDDPIVRRIAKKARGTVVWFSLKKRLPRWVPLRRIKLLGDHNRANVLAACASGDALGIPRRAMIQIISSFQGLPGRLELVCTVNGVRYYNDTTSTTPDATIAALRTFASPSRSLVRARNRKRGRSQHLVLIAGGTDKRLNYRRCAENIQNYCKALILLPGSATKKMLREAKKLKLAIPVVRVANMRRAVRAAHTHAAHGDVVLFSPGAASFGLFINEFDRGRVFMKAVWQLK